MNIKRNAVIVIILLLALVNGLIYVFAVPVWEHYDEPGNFEYAWLLAHRSGTPKYGDYDPSMRKAVLSSLINSHFFEHRGFPMPQPSLNDNPAWIGVTQVGDPPIYFWLAALPMRLMPPLAIDSQLYAGRLVSLLMLLVTILAAWGIMAELMPEGHPLRWMVPAMLALLPGFTDIMTSVNSDVGAVLFYTLWLWVAMRMICRRLTVLNLVLFFILSAACILTKKTVYVVLATAPIGLLLALIKGRWRILVFVIPVLAALFILSQMVTWDDTAGWYRSTSQSQPGRVSVSTPIPDDAPTAGFALQVAVNPGTSGFQPAFSQNLPAEVTPELSGKTVTVAGWMWATAPIHSTTPALHIFDRQPSSDNWVETNPILLSPTPQYFSVHYQIPDQARLIVLSAAPIADKKQKGVVSVFYSHLVVVNGAFPLDQAPQFEDSRAISGTWGGRKFTNLVGNPASLDVWPRWNGKLFTQINNKLGIGNDTYGLIAYVLDLPRYKDYALMTAGNLFRTFWAKFNWSQVSLTGSKPYRALLFATLLSFIGIGMLVARRWRKIPWGTASFLLLIAILCWTYTFFIGVIIRPLTEPSFITAARYAYPAIVPTAIALNGGWWQLGKLFNRWKAHPMPRLTGPIFYFALFLGLDAYSLVSLIQFYR